MKSFSPRALLPIYGIGVVGAFLQIAGGQWDVSWHILGIVETFFTPAHTVLYAGIGLVALANLQGVRLRLAHADNSQYGSLFTGLRVAVVGTELQIIAAPFDLYWHSVHGFDPFLFTPAHSILILGVVIGGIGMTLGAIRLLQVQREGLEITTRPWILPAMVVLGLAAMWGQFNFVSYWLTDVSGMAYTFGYCGVPVFRNLSTCGFVDQFRPASQLISFGIFAGAGTFFFWTSKKLFHRTGVTILTAAILAAVYSNLAIGFTAYALTFMNPPGSFYLTSPSPDKGTALASLIPIYLLALVPISLLDLTVKNPIGKKSSVALSALVGPFASFIDGRYVVGILSSGTSLLVIAVPTILGGLVGGLLLTRLGRRIFLEIEGPGLKWQTTPMIPVNTFGGEPEPVKSR